MASQAWREKNKDKLRSYRRAWYRRNSAHAKQKVIERRQAILTFIESHKKNSSCERCDENFFRCLDFHHQDPKDKLVSLSQLARSKGWSTKKIEEEIRKCILLCANCHRKETFAHERIDTGV